MKLVALVALPPLVVTLIFPVVAPVGTVAVISMSETSVKLADFPLNVTFVVLPAVAKGVIPEGGPRFIDNRSFGGPIPVMVIDAVDAIARNMRVAGTVKGVGREDTYEYPIEALREAVVNALMHRDYGQLARGTQVPVEMYPDRLLIRNPGGLFGAICIGIPPMLLLGFSVVRSEHEAILGMSSFAFGMILIGAGFVAYFVNHALKPAGWTAAQEEKPQPAA